MTVPFLPVHILSKLAVIHTARGEAGQLAERLPHWQKGLRYPGRWTPTTRQLRRWRLLYAYWLAEQDMLLKRSVRRKHLDAGLAMQLRELGETLAPPDVEPVVPVIDGRIQACVEAPFPWRERHGLVEPIGIGKLTLEPRIPPFQLLARFVDAQLVHTGNRALLTLGVCLGQALALDEPLPLALDARLPEELRLRDEGFALPLALAVLQALGEAEVAGLAADGGLDGDGRLLPPTGFETAYGKLEACFDAGCRLLCLPWGTQLYALPKAGIELDHPQKGVFHYFLSDDPGDRLEVRWIKDIREATRLIWGDAEPRIADRLRAHTAPPPERPFDNWESLYRRIEAEYPDWLAIAFKLFYELYRELALGEAETGDWEDLLRQQARWVHLWLRYLFTLQASGMWLARQPIEELWPLFPACCDGEASLYLLWQSLQQLCQLEQRGPLPFRHMHQWLSRHQTGWGLLLNQLIQLEGEQQAAPLREGLRYNMQRLMELLKSAEFMFHYPLYGVLPNQAGNPEPGQTLGLQYQGQARPGMLLGEVPVQPGGLYLEDPRTRTRFQLVFLQLCPACCDLEQFAPLAFADRGPEGALRFAGCEHLALAVDSGEVPVATGLASTYGWSTESWVTARRRLTEPESGGEVPMLATVLRSEMLLDVYTTLQDPLPLLRTYERMVQELLAFLQLNAEDAEQIQVRFDAQNLEIAFLRHPESGLLFALSLHQLVSDYNARQSVPSAHLQLRTGLDAGCVWLGSGPGRLSGGPQQRAQWLAQHAEAGQLLASETLRELLARISAEHRQLFHLVGATSVQADEAENVYTVYTRGTGLRRIPARLPRKFPGPLSPSALETLAMTRRPPVLNWYAALALAPAGGEPTALEPLLNRLAGAHGWEPALVPFERGLIAVFDRPLEAVIQLAFELGEQTEAAALQLALGFGLGELRPRADSCFSLRGPLLAGLQALLERRQAGQVLCDARSFALLAELAPERAAGFAPVPGAEPLIYSAGAATPPAAPEQAPPMGLAEVFDPQAVQPLNAVLIEAKKLARSRLDHLVQDRLGAGLAQASPQRVIQNHLGMLFQLIRPGHFTMGSPRSEVGRTEDETQHLVVLTRPFYLLTTTVNQKQWERIMDGNPSFFRHPDLPVEAVSWDEVAAFIARLNRLGAEKYRLPTEAEWEYCCRADSKTAYCYGDAVTDLGSYAWYQANSGEGYAVRQPHPVATRHPNSWGLYDLHGNVWEWVSDWYDALPAKAVTNPAGPEQGNARVIRGGRWNSSATSCRSASRSFLPPSQGYPGSLGFRLVMEA